MTADSHRFFNRNRPILVGQMHPALQIQEILFNIFSRCCQPPEECRDTSWLAALARTCRAFKEPALDILWQDLDNFSPLYRCLPEVYCVSEHTHYCSCCTGKRYSFIRPLTEIEWDILRNYTRRIQSLEDFSATLIDKTFFNPPTTEPLFPRLRSLGSDYRAETVLLSQLPIPSLSSLELHCDHLLPRDKLQSLPILFPNISSLSICMREWQDPLVCQIEPDYFTQWKKLDTLICDKLVLDVNCVVHLSHIPTLTRLSFTLINKLPASYPIVHFGNLQELTVCCDSLATLSRLLSQTELSVITDFYVDINRCEETFDLRTPHAFFSILQKANPTHTIKTLFFSGLSSSGDAPRPQTDLHLLQPCIAFHDLRCFRVEMRLKVSLTDKELLTLVSAWPQLEEFVLNKCWGWNTTSGITPNGLLQLLQKCRALNRVALAIDTQGEIPELPEDFGSTLPDTFSINVVDSRIGPEDVPGMKAFFAGFASGCDFSLVAWNNWMMLGDDECDVHRERWNEVFPLGDDSDYMDI